MGRPNHLADARTAHQVQTQTIWKGLQKNIAQDMYKTSSEDSSAPFVVVEVLLKLARIWKLECGQDFDVDAKVFHCISAPNTCEGIFCLFQV